jgi:hypothetical protein
MAEQNKRAAAIEEPCDEGIHAAFERGSKRAAVSKGNKAGFTLVPALSVIPPDKIAAAQDAVAFGIKFKGLSKEVEAYVLERGIARWERWYPSADCAPKRSFMGVV